MANMVRVAEQYGCCNGCFLNYSPHYLWDGCFIYESDGTDIQIVLLIFLNRDGKEVVCSARCKR